MSDDTKPPDPPANLEEATRYLRFAIEAVSDGLQDAITAVGGEVVNAAFIVTVRWDALDGKRTGAVDGLGFDHPGEVAEYIGEALAHLPGVEVQVIAPDMN